MFGFIHNYLRKREAQRREAVLKILREQGELSAFEIGKMAKMWSGHLYVILRRLEETGEISSRWNWPYPLKNNSRKRLYRIAES